EGLVPGELLFGQTAPEAFRVLVGFVAQSLVLRHAGDPRIGGEFLRRIENPVFDQHGINGRRHYCSSSDSPPMEGGTSSIRNAPVAPRRGWARARRQGKARASNGR